MLGPVLSAEDLATQNKTDKVLSCSYEASTAGDSNQVTAHVGKMSTMSRHFLYRVPQWGTADTFRGSSLLCRLARMLQDLVSLVLCSVLSDTLPHDPLQSLEHPSTHPQFNTPYRDTVLPPSRNTTQSHFILTTTS